MPFIYSKNKLSEKMKWKANRQKKRFSFYYPRKTINFNWIKQKRLFFMFFRRVNLVNGDFCDEKLNRIRFFGLENCGGRGFFHQKLLKFVQRTEKSISVVSRPWKIFFNDCVSTSERTFNSFFRKIPRKCMQTWRKYLMCIQITLIDLERSTSTNRFIAIFLECDEIEELFSNQNFQINQKTFSIPWNSIFYKIQEHFHQYSLS